MDKFIPINDSSLLERFEKEGEPIAIGSYEDYLKLPLPDCYIRRLEAEKKKSIDNVKETTTDASRPTDNS